MHCKDLILQLQHVHANCYSEDRSRRHLQNGKAILVDIVQNCRLAMQFKIPKVLYVLYEQVPIKITSNVIQKPFFFVDLAKSLTTGPLFILCSSLGGTTSQ